MTSTDAKVPAPQTILLRSDRRSRCVAEIGVLLSAAAGLYVVMLHNFPLFHLLAELFSVVVGATMFVIAWNSRETNQSTFLAIIGLCFPGVAALDLLHAVAYKGIDVIGDGTPDTATQLWTAARCLQAAIILGAAYLAVQTPNTAQPAKPSSHALVILVAQGVVVSILLILIFLTDLFPACFVVGQGPTDFKIAAEYVVIGMTLITCVILIRHRHRFDPGLFALSLAGIALIIPQELAFTLYTDPFGTWNAIGHFLKLLSFYLLFKAIVVTALKHPHEVIFHRLASSQQALHRHLGTLEAMVEDRTTELRNSEQRWRTLLECSNDWFWESDLNDHFRVLSPRSGTVTQLAKLDLQATRTHELLDPDRPAEDFPRLLEAVANGQPFSRLTFPLATLSGTARWMMISGVPRYDALGNSIGYWGTASEITAQRQAQEIARQRQTMAALGGLVGGLAHEINNLLQPVVSLSDLAGRRVQDDARLKTYLQAIHDSGLKARVILRDVLQFARVEVTDSPPGNLDEAMRSAVELIEPNLPSSIRLRVTSAPDLPPVTVTATELTQIFLNLLQNAVDAIGNKGGEIILFADRRQLRQPEASQRAMPVGDYVRLIVRDTGAGMDATTRQRLFEPFFTTKPVGKGTGLGLSVVYGIVSNGGGEITVESAPGLGTQFIISLPVITASGPVPGRPTEDVVPPAVEC